MAPIFYSAPPIFLIAPKAYPVIPSLPTQAIATVHLITAQTGYHIINVLFKLNCTTNYA